MDDSQRIYDLIDKIDTRAQERHNTLVLDINTKHIESVKKMAVVETHIENCRNFKEVDEVKASLDKHINVDMWKTYIKETVKLVLAGIAGLIGYKIGK